MWSRVVDQSCDSSGMTNTSSSLALSPRFFQLSYVTRTHARGPPRNSSREGRPRGCRRQRGSARRRPQTTGYQSSCCRWSPTCRPRPWSWRGAGLLGTQDLDAGFEEPAEAAAARRADDVVIDLARCRATTRTHAVRQREGPLPSAGREGSTGSWDRSRGAPKRWRAGTSYTSRNCRSPVSCGRLGLGSRPEAGVVRGSTLHRRGARPSPPASSDKGALQRPDRRPLDQDVRVAPVTIRLPVACPLRADARATRDPDPSVDNQDSAVVAVIVTPGRLKRPSGRKVIVRPPRPSRISACSHAMERVPKPSSRMLAVTPARQRSASACAISWAIGLRHKSIPRS